MTHDQREIHRKKQVIEYAEQTGNVHKTCRYFGVARSTFYLWRERYREQLPEWIAKRVSSSPALHRARESAPSSRPESEVPMGAVTASVFR